MTLGSNTAQIRFIIAMALVSLSMKVMPPEYHEQLNEKALKKLARTHGYEVIPQ